MAGSFHHFSGGLTLYSFKELQDEISAKIEWLRQNNGKTLHPDWITQAVMSDHSDISGRDTDFHLCCSRLSVRKEVTQQINKVGANTPDNQLKLDGFDHLQQYYVVARDSERVAVRIDDLTKAEVESKALEYESMGRACMQHADELRRYLSIRESQQELEIA
jgi:hypothetical protein